MSEPRAPDLSPVASPWAPLNRPLFRALWIAAIVSNVGTWMQDVGAGWLMTSLAPAPLMVALVQTATTLPVMLLVLPAGALADIVDRRRYLIGTQCWMLAVSALLGVLTFAGITTAWMLLAFTFALGIGSALMMPAWSSIVPEIVPRSELQSAIALNSVGVNVSRAIGPALAGLIVAAIGSWLVFLLNAVSYLGIIGVLIAWRREPSKSALPAERFVSALRAGLRFVWHTPELQAVLVRGCAFFVFASATWALFPVIVRHELGRGPEVYGALLACIGIGAVSGALFLPRLRSMFSRDHLVAGATVLYACAGLMLAYVRDVYVLGIAMLATGAAWISVLSSLQVSAQTALPAWVRARGLAAYMIVFMGGMAAGSLLWGHIATLAGIPAALTAAAAAAVLGVLATWKFKIGAQEAVDLAPSMHWPAPLVSEEPEMEHGPVMVTIEYRIDPSRSAEFVELMQEMRRIRQRDGAFFWELFKDAADPARVVECFMNESWLEHLRQHERVSMADREVEARVQAFQLGGEPPRVSHLLAQRIPDRPFFDSQRTG